MKILLRMPFCVLLLIAVLGKAQQVTARDAPCQERQYFLEALQKCCSRCPPGSFMKKDCTKTSDTQCQACEDGKYTSSWNFVEKCSLCRPCPSYLVMTEKCSTIKKEKCECKEGSNCTQFDGLGVCQVCMPILFPTTVPTPQPEPSIAQATSGINHSGFMEGGQRLFGYVNYPLWATAIILALVVITALVIMVIKYVRGNKGILEKLGCMAKIKKPLPESTALEIVSTTATTEALLSYKDPQFPIQESDPKQSAEYALNSTHRNPI